MKAKEMKAKRMNKRKINYDFIFGEAVISIKKKKKFFFVCLNGKIFLLAVGLSNVKKKNRFLMI